MWVEKVGRIVSCGCFVHVEVVRTQRGAVFPAYRSIVVIVRIVLPREVSSCDQVVDAHHFITEKKEEMVDSLGTAFILLGYVVCPVNYRSWEDFNVVSFLDLFLFRVE